MKKSFFISMILLGSTIFVACEQNPNAADSDNFMNQSMAAKPTTAANPAIVYNSGSSVYVMDSTGSNQTVVHTAASGISVFGPNWSPSNSIAWTELTSSASAVRASDITVNSSGIPVSSNTRTITSLSSSTHDLQRGVWSSTTTTNKIAFALNGRLNTSANTYVCRVSASGGSWDTLYTAPYALTVQGLSWNSDDTRIAILLRTRGSETTNSIVIVNTSTGAVTDSIGIALGIDLNGLNLIEWSRASSSINKLVFVAGGKICYLTPTTGSTPTTNNVSWAVDGSVTWSPSNSSVMFIKSGSRGTYSLEKNKVQTVTVSSIDKSFSVGNGMNWHR